jgi:hypothetical protein
MQVHSLQEYQAAFRDGLDLGAASTSGLDTGAAVGEGRTTMEGTS